MSITGGGGAVPWAGLAVFGVVAAAWGKVKAVLQSIANLLIVRTHLEGWAAHAIMGYCWENMRRTPFGLRKFETMYSYVRSKRRHMYVALETVADEPVTFWRGILPIWVSTGSKNNDVPGGMSIHEGVNVNFIRGTLNVEELVKKVMADLNDYAIIEGGVSRRFRIRHIFGEGENNGKSGDGSGARIVDETDNSDHDVMHTRGRRLIGYDLGDLGARVLTDGKALDLLAMPTAVMEAVEEVQRWLKSERWYRENGISWKRGWLCEGEPGTGKTALVRGMAHDMDLPVFVYDLATLNNQEMVKEWRHMMRYAPCIALLEDIDTVFDGRKNIASRMHNPLTFDCVLNCLDGVERTDGVFVIVTTNRIKKLDPALGRPVNGEEVSTRPGRIDRVIHLCELDEDCRRKLAGRILHDYPDLIEKVVAAGEGETGAQFQYRCSRIALARFWEEREGGEQNGEMGKQGDGAVRGVEQVSQEEEAEPQGDVRESETPVGDYTETARIAGKTMNRS
jgi:hypothetical protein